MNDTTTTTTTRDATGRTTELLRDRDGLLLGANVFLTPAQLDALGIEAETTPQIRHWVNDECELTVEPHTYHEDAAAASHQTDLTLESGD